MKTACRCDSAIRHNSSWNWQIMVCCPYCDSKLIDDKGLPSDTLKEKEPHPSSLSALEYVRLRLTHKLKEAMASCVIENNRTAEICLGTIKRLEKGEPVSDRYVLGLAWFILEINSKDKI